MLTILAITLCIIFFEELATLCILAITVGIPMGVVGAMLFLLFKL